MFEELREPLDDPNQVGNLDAVGGGVRLVSRPLHRRREVPVQPVVRVDGDDASLDLRKGDVANRCEVAQVRVSHYPSDRLPVY